MKKLTKSIFTLAAIALIFNLSSCKQINKKNISNNEAAKPLMKNAVKKQVENFVYPLPTSFELTSMLNRIGADYILGLSNNPENVDKYYTSKSKALALGIYSADLSYASTYRRKNETMGYIDASKKIVQSLQIEGAFDAELVKAIEKNIDNKEKLTEILTDAFSNTYTYLSKNSNENLALLVVTGSFIEGLYIATHISDNTFENQEIVKIIFDQKASLDKLISILKDEKQDKVINEILTDLKKLEASYNSIKNGSMTKDQLIKITSEIKSLRERLV
ncbi:MAG: hypothetical protein N4A49_16515 [Marinifilaceae bacterium]|jgi:hypothetical protein|nr:hypothetical protein [Marinifilaceae bacterium]